MVVWHHPPPSTNLAQPFDRLPTVTPTECSSRLKSTDPGHCGIHRTRERPSGDPNEHVMIRVRLACVRRRRAAGPRSLHKMIHKPVEYLNLGLHARGRVWVRGAWKNDVCPARPVSSLLRTPPLFRFCHRLGFTRRHSEERVVVDACRQCQRACRRRRY